MPRTANPCTYLPRRLQIVASLTVFVLVCIFFLGSSGPGDSDSYFSNVPYGPQIQQGAHQVVDRLPKLPKDLPHVNAPHWLNPFHGPAHKPLEQANSSSGEARWYTDFKWRTPFSSDTTLDEERAVLPPLAKRAPVYTYFESTGKDEKSKTAEQQLLQLWRRAWWAQGFRPVVLGKPEAMNNPLFRAVQGLELEPEMEKEMMRWLAWGNMGTGILSNWLAVPMAAHDDNMLAFLRRAEYPSLTRYEGLENGLFVGNREDINKALKEAIASPAIKRVKGMAEAVAAETFTVDPEHSAIALYSTSTITSKYSLIGQKLDKPSTAGDGLAMLPALINSHLHMTWQNIFSSGIAVLKPLPQHTTTLIEPAIDIARNLSQCPDTPIPASCPPNRPRCKPCVSSQMLITVPPVFRNTSTLFTIATVPHPYTLTSLLHSRLDMNVKFIRRQTDRDSWVLAATKELLGTGLSSFSRLPALKDIIASEYSSARTLWLVAEMPPSRESELDLEGLDWHFGFTLPRSPMPDGKSETPVPGPERRPPPPKSEFGDGPPLSEQELSHERSLLEQAKMVLRRTGSRKAKTSAKTAKALSFMREVVEAWSLADTECWKFVRAWEARRRVERRGWEGEEERFQGKGMFGRWIDQVT
ncbi:hypothetical protein LTR02_003009 [Friedmanniomyces endolithicus]|nr:hypothetical protein LTR94_016470 [Friedmanniomyces endolithicus]KAK0786943.1 hypothetical protein LTR75_013033 [Friedmanniomyces endolithicus]KAK0799893.1 hypothetical protein LTR59_005953 [Friedmanniomyces endolithicus]KAK0820258.1 hypothetical protein LTR38_000167 [Friedmanniomyces endolithicus]KAK0850988.1 hypothetical protein LTR03_004278 [Friedmanniomyces endolithicus]